MTNIPDLPDIASREGWKNLPRASGEEVELPTSKPVRFAYACPYRDPVTTQLCKYAATQEITVDARPKCPTHNNLQMVPIGTVYDTLRGFASFPG